MDVEAYLRRIRHVGEVQPSELTLRSLHRAHMFAVPFENLDIGLGRTIVCDEDWFLHKIVDERRGGFCYEMNGAFAVLLRALGFQVTLLSARVSRADGSNGPDFDHMALRVDLEEAWLADVGFGDSFVEPLRLQPLAAAETRHAASLPQEQEQFGRLYRITSEGDRLCYEANTDDAWKRQYVFTLQPRQLSEFAGMCHYHQTSPDSHFTRNRVCSLATPEGRITLTNERLIETVQGARTEQVLKPTEWNEKLRELFGVILA